MSNELDFNETSKLNFTHDINAVANGLIPNPDIDDLDSKEIEDFLYEDSAQKIYAFLMGQFWHHGFCDYLKRYIYREAKLSGSFNTIPDETYQSIIIENFKNNLTDFSFYKTKANNEEVTLDWLKRKVVSRETVLLLGFGLNMCLEEVNSMLNKSLHEPFIDPKDPLEATCYYCFRNHFPFPRFKKIWDKFDPDHPIAVTPGKDMYSTFQFQAQLDDIDNDDEMFAYLFSLPIFHGTKRQSLTARREFDRLFDSVQIGLQRRRQKDEVFEAGLFEGQKAENEDESEEKINKKKEIENVLYAFVPRNDAENLMPLDGSSLKDLFYGKRLNRQRITQIQKGASPITRYDLITMSFLDFDLQRDNQPNIMKEHYKAFIDSTNSILEKCNMDKMYAANPYECFIMLCMKTESPIEVHSEVWGMSYDGE